MNYQFTLPTRFEQADVPKDSLPAGMEIGVWKAMVDQTEPSALLIVQSTTNENLSKEARQNMRQSLVNLSAGATDRMGIKIVGRGPTEKSDISGIEFTHFVWVGMRADKKQCGGSIYGFLEDDRMVFLLHISFESDPEKTMSEMKQHMASFRRKDSEATLSTE